MSFDTLLYEVDEGVATVTLNRPDVYNAFNTKMCEELSGLWKSLQTNDDVRCVVLTAAGEKAFCTGIDRSEIPTDGGEFDPDTYKDPGAKLGPKSNELFKPVIAAVNGMACGGAFYMLGEVEFIIAAENATFFDPHVTYGMTAVFEPLLMMRRMPFGEIARMTLTGSHERMSAKRAYEIGLVSEVVPAAALGESGHRVAAAIASQPAHAVQATVRALWTGAERSVTGALAMGAELLAAGTTSEALEEGQRAFQSGKRIEPRTR
ncbi:MAG: enoyl-CoA hydratase/isomerase family protein [Actinomycetota bacterium]